MGHSRVYHIMGYAGVVKSSRRVFTAMNLLEAYQETVKAAREGVKIVEWTYQTKAGAKILGLEEGEFYRKAEEMPKPKGLTRCPRCAGKGCQVCRWAGETTRRVLALYRPEQLEPIKGRE